MDARIDPARILGLAPGDAHVLRNAGGVVTDDVIRSLAVSQHLLGTVEVAVIMHTDCGMQKFEGDQFRAQLERETGVRPSWAVETFGDLDQELRQSMARIQASPFVPHANVRGFIFDVRTGRLAEVT